MEKHGTGSIHVADTELSWRRSLHARPVSSTVRPAI